MDAVDVQVKHLRSNKDPKEVCNCFVNFSTVIKGVQSKIVTDREGERSDSRLSKIPHEESLGKFGWIFQFFIEKVYF